MSRNKLRMFILVACVLGIAFLLESVLHFEDEITTLGERVIKHINEDIKYISIDKRISLETYESINQIIKDPQEIAFIMNSLSDVQLLKTDSGIPSIVDTAYQITIGGERDLLYGFIFSIHGLILMYDYQTSQDSLYQMNDFDLELFQRYFD